MSDEKEMKLVVPKSLMVVLWLIAGGLFANGLQFLSVKSTNARPSPTKVGICNEFGDNCADVLKDEGGFLSLMTAGW